MNEYGYVTLASEVISAAIDDYKSILHRYKKAKSDIERKKLEYDLMQTEKFFNNSPLMAVLTISGEELIKELRRQDKEEQ